MNAAHPYLCLKLAQAAKTSQRAEGLITYRLLSNPERNEVFVMIDANEGGGYFSHEAVPFSKIEACLIGLQANQLLPAKTFRAAYIGKSSNNAGFLTAILRVEKLLTAAGDSAYQHQVSGDWSKWKSDTLALSGEPYTPPALNNASDADNQAILAGKAGSEGISTRKRKSPANQPEKLPPSTDNGGRHEDTA